ncbi:hypothetical protein [Acrocarpospora sp. B8E8]|uniref:hypothetical protein n=1 Tax=Acrocarpospora sp. B8E8 TaxID=3153572 RepID=UPI00325F2C5C
MCPAIRIAGWFAGHALTLASGGGDRIGLGDEQPVGPVAFQGGGVGGQGALQLFAGGAGLAVAGPVGVGFQQVAGEVEAGGLPVAGHRGVQGVRVQARPVDQGVLGGQALGGRHRHGGAVGQATGRDVVRADPLADQPRAVRRTGAPLHLHPPVSTDGGDAAPVAVQHVQALTAPGPVIVAAYADVFADRQRQRLSAGEKVKAVRAIQLAAGAADRSGGCVQPVGGLIGAREQQHLGELVMNAFSILPRGLRWPAEFTRTPGSPKPTPATSAPWTSCKSSAKTRSACTSRG